MTKAMPRTGFASCLALAAALALAGCGKEADPAAPAPSAGQPTEGAPAEPPAQPTDEPTGEEPASPPEPSEPGAEPSSNPSPSNPSSPSAPTTPEECRAAGGTFVPSIGDEPHCPQGTRSLGPIRHGIEGGLCCK
jgi:hypothetical protein